MSTARENKDHLSGKDEQAREAEPAAPAHRTYVGVLKSYDVIAATQFALMIALGLREHHALLDIGCGSLCGGRLFIPYLLPGRYYGIEPQAWLVEDGIRFEVSEELRRLKQPSFRYQDDFSLSGFDVLFDFMLAQSVLTHVSQTQLDRCLSQAKLALKPEGMFAASFFAEGEEIYSGADWLYPGFASYSFKFVIERARQHGLIAYPLVWANVYGHYWVVFAHDAHAERISWLADFGSEQRMLRVLELTKELNDVRLNYAKTKEKLAEAEQELANLRTGKPSRDDLR
jgi:hypothetical protein